LKLVGVLLFSTSLFAGCKPEEESAREAESAAQAARDAAAKPPMEDQLAKAGVGVQGNSLDDIKGEDPRLILVGPIKTLFQTKERIVFDMLKHAQDLYNASNGRDPRTHEEYMREIVDANKIKLPKLPEGMVYRYRPDNNELWVEAEKKN